LYKKIRVGGLIFYDIRLYATYCSTVMHALVIFVLLLFPLPGASSAEPKEYYSRYESVLEETGPDPVTSQLREGDEIRESGDLTGFLHVGIGWVDPIQDDSTSEKVFELGYQVQLSRHISIMPNVQYLVDAANNADQNRIFITSFRTNTTL
jgi:hypothetical protein